MCGPPVFWRYSKANAQLLAHACERRKTDLKSSQPGKSLLLLLQVIGKLKDVDSESKEACLDKRQQSGHTSWHLSLLYKADNKTVMRSLLHKHIQHVVFVAEYAQQQTGTKDHTKNETSKRLSGGTNPLTQAHTPFKMSIILNLSLTGTIRV